MRKITQEATQAFFEGKNFNKQNTAVEYLLQPHAETTELFLHSNLIARFNLRSRELMVTSAGWLTNTTKERLNGILSKFGFGIFQKKGEWFLSDKKGAVVPFVDGMTLEV